MFYNAGCRPCGHCLIDCVQLVFYILLCAIGFVNRLSRKIFLFRPCIQNSSYHHRYCIFLICNRSRHHIRQSPTGVPRNRRMRIFSEHPLFYRPHICIGRNLAALQVFFPVNLRKSDQPCPCPHPSEPIFRQPYYPFISRPSRVRGGCSIRRLLLPHLHQQGQREPLVFHQVSGLSSGIPVLSQG